ncbi:MAG: serine/threonine protein kinase [Gemmatimonadaceae bacterium]|nr:serine/threonine protein kinase [Gemmatimonadaceae bacterium]
MQQHDIAMDAARWREIEPLFTQALALTAAEQPGYLDAVTGADTTLRAELVRLLAASRAPDLFIDGCAADRFDALIAGEEPAQAAGQVVGPYRLVSEIGRGGMGVVYLAERADEQFTQRVALKLVKRGMDTDFVLRRFRAERQILASLSHPNVARLLDGGTTADGRPYFVMEHIEGRRIDVYAREANLGLGARLDLFLRVCDAVGYAHQQLVVHRDIKPANIVVTADGAPRLLDFGIASLLDDDGTGGTATGVRALTPEYASPEQADGQRVGTASDVYSLGVVLFQLVTCALPQEFTSRRPAEIATQLRSTPPRRPSEVARAEAAGWRKRLRGDLDTIIRTALEPVIARRYASVEALATDLRRHRAGIPVLARPASVGYRVTRFVQRNRLLVAGSAALLATMLAGSVAFAWQARVARHQAVSAERRFSDLRALAHNVLFDYHDAIQSLPGATPVRARLVQDGLEYLDRLSADSIEDRSLQLELAEAYQRMGDVQGGSMRANLGNSAGAIASYRKSLALLERLAAAPATAADSVAAPADARRSVVLSELGVLYWETGDLATARAMMSRARDLLVPQLRHRPADDALHYSMNHRRDYLAQILFAMGETVAARAEYDAALASLDSISPAERGSVSVRRSYSVTLQHLGELLADQGNLTAALATSQRALALRRALAAEEPLNAELQRALSVAYYYEGENLGRLGRFREARASYESDLRIVSALLRADPDNALYRGDAEYAYTRIGDMLGNAGRLQDAIRNYDASYAMHAVDVRADSTNIWKRAAMIEAQAKGAAGYARLRDRRAALPRLQAVEAAMLHTVVDTADATIRSFFAETWTGLGASWLALGGPASDCTAAGRQLARADSVLGDMLRRRQASHPDSLRIDEIARLQRRALQECPPG